MCDAPAPGTWQLAAPALETTLGAWGCRAIHGGAPFTIEAPSLGLAVRIGREVDLDPRNRDRLGYRMRAASALALRSFGGEDLTGAPLPRRLAATLDLRVSDVHYLGLLLLAAEDGGQVEVELTYPRACPTCAAPLPPSAVVDLHGMPVLAWEDAPAQATYALRAASDWRPHGAPVRTVTLEAPRAERALCPLTVRDLQAALVWQPHWVASAVVALDKAPRTLEASALEGLGRHDWAGLLGAQDACFGGPGGTAPWPCPACGEPVPVPIDWADAFFGYSAG